MKMITGRQGRLFARVLLIALVAAAMLILPGCSALNLSEQTRGYVFKPDKAAKLADHEVFIRDMNQFGFTAMKLIHEAKGSENCLISPTSLATAFSLVSHGAAGQTRDEINALLNTENLSPEQLSGKYYSLMSGFYNRKDVSIIMANSLWMQEGLKLEKRFLELAKTRYNAEVQSLDFQAPTAVKTINDWISGKTSGFLKNTLDRINGDAAALLINTLYFKGRWNNTFSEKETQKESFTLSKGETIQVDMMNGGYQTSYCRVDGLEAIRMPYEGPAYMLMIRPEGDIDGLMASLSADKLQEIQDAFAQYQVTMKIPKFAFSSKNSMVSNLQAMGMTEAFSDTADFTGMIKDPPVKINDVIHDCRIELDEEGTTAAAATVVEFDKAMASKPPENRNFFLDKPFAFAIIDSYSGAILFLGKVENPNAQ